MFLLLTIPKGNGRWRWRSGMLYQVTESGTTFCCYTWDQWKTTKYARKRCFMAGQILTDLDFLLQHLLPRHASRSCCFYLSSYPQVLVKVRTADGTFTPNFVQYITSVPGSTLRHDKTPLNTCWPAGVTSPPNASNSISTVWYSRSNFNMERKFWFSFVGHRGSKKDERAQVWSKPFDSGSEVLRVSRTTLNLFNKEAFPFIKGHFLNSKWG